jgi:two-component system, NtrC family, sensor kinase
MIDDLPPSKADILVVDDTPDNLRLLVRLLTEQGYKVRPVPSGKLALAAVQGQPPDLILLDINMPDMNGYEVCQQLKSNEQTRQIPVIFLSALNEVLDKVTAFSVGGIDYITKPFQIEEVLVRIQTHLAIGALQKHLQQKNETLSQTLHDLQTTQAQLVQSEKLAALGYLVANVAHEMNTPLAAIQSAITTITHFLNRNLEQLPQFFQALEGDRQQDFFALLRASTASVSAFSHLSNRDKRQYKRHLIHELEARSIASAEAIADHLVDMGIYENLQPFWPLLQMPESGQILNMAYDFVCLQKSTQTIAVATDRATKVILALKSYARQNHEGQRVAANVITGLETALTLYYHQMKHSVEVIKTYADVPPILCFPDELNQVWTNLIHNALQAMNYCGVLSITVIHEAGYVKVNITDNGVGIPAAMQARIFDPFFTTKPMGEGSGLGLSIVQKIIDKHRGTIAVKSEPGQTTFAIVLPVE